ncbi:hypothetical protein J2X06_001749 [Lysobacter niastensis]|uniref:Uncharacterized protein n=1 Tax=Lysobacter niastensis TaxID=380629 RepID=A0ABU1WB06_9GAMM|nr:hypothetical protein [Lysobacter niastensis]MDR7134565.1 hypothetical protein [Lysobacter niastensis]
MTRLTIEDRLVRRRLIDDVDKERAQLLKAASRCAEAQLPPNFREYIAALEKVATDLGRGLKSPHVERAANLYREIIAGRTTLNEAVKALVLHDSIRDRRRDLEMQFIALGKDLATARRLAEAVLQAEEHQHPTGVEAERLDRRARKTLARLKG